MEVNLKREAIQYCTPVYSDTLSREETLETVVSDTLPDVARILDVDAAVYLRSKTLLQGSIRIEGSIRGTVLYIGEDSERLQRIEAELPVSFSAEADGTEDTFLLQNSKTTDLSIVRNRQIPFDMQYLRNPAEALQFRMRYSNRGWKSQFLTFYGFRDGLQLNDQFSYAPLWSNRFISRMEITGSRKGIFTKLFAYYDDWNNTDV